MSLPLAPLAERTQPLAKPAPDAVLLTLHAMIAAFNNHDADAFAALFAPDAWFVNVLGHRFTGRTEIAEAHRFVFSTALAQSQVECTEVATRSVTDDVALIEAVWTSADSTGNADNTGSRDGIMVLLLQRNEQDEWAILHCTNTDYSGPPDFS